jgi:monoamine oxidase
MLKPAFRSEVDIAVIGAGAAGIAAGRRLAEAKADFTVLEARSRIGGRAWTAPVEGYPQDMGCGWLHSGDVNPWTRIAEATGFTVDRTPAPWTSEKRDESFSEAEFHAWRAAAAAFYERLDAAGEEANDRAASEFLEPGGRWNELLNAISTYANGAELDLVSVRDVTHYADDNVNWRVREGFGAMIAAYGGALPVVLDCAVLRIDHTGKMLRVETSRGTLMARAAIVALPTPAITNESVRFTPALPEKLEAATGLPLGLADKVLLAVDRAEEFQPDSRLFGRTDRTEVGAYHMRPFGRPLIEGFFGGQLAKRLEEEGEGAFTAFAIDELASQLGNAVKARLRPLAATAWGRDPLALGSYSHALPGRAGSRSILVQPVEDRIFFAGEACSLESFSTAHGAFETGAKAADLAISAFAR